MSIVILFWAAARTIESGWKFHGRETLGLTPNGEGVVPLTDAPFIDYQLSAILVQGVLLPLRADVLGTLHKLTLAHSKSDWFVMFLANYIILRSYSRLMNQQRSWARKKGSLVRHPYPSGDIVHCLILATVSIHFNATHYQHPFGFQNFIVSLPLYLQRAGTV